MRYCPALWTPLLCSIPYTLYVILLLNIIALYVIIRYEAFKGNVVNVPNMHIGYICTVYVCPCGDWRVRFLVWSAFHGVSLCFRVCFLVCVSYLYFTVRFLVCVSQCGGLVPSLAAK